MKETLKQLSKKDNARDKGERKSKKRPVNELDDDGNEKENLATVDTNQDTASNKDPGPVLENHTAIP